MTNIPGENVNFLLNRGLSEALFEGFFVQRWNDRIRPVNLTEADKHASKMMITLFIGKKLEDKGTEINWRDVVDKGIFDALTRYAISDISSVVHAKLRENADVYVAAITKIVDKQYRQILPKEFLDKYKQYILNEKTAELELSDHIIRLSHQLSLRQEFKIISSLGYGSFFLDHEESGGNIDKRINDSCTNIGLDPILDETGEVAWKDLSLILKLIDRLRYQVRWSQTPRVPNTSVLGHSFYVAGCTYFATTNMHSDKRVVNNFYASLMHDFLEALTRDIISPVKNSSSEFKNEIARIEEEMLDQNLLPELSGKYKGYLSMILRDEFSNRGFNDDYSVSSSCSSDDCSYYFDGQIVQASDYFAALLEAHQSISLGISSHHLVGAISRLYATFKSMEPKFTDKYTYSKYLELYDSFISR